MSAPGVALPAAPAPPHAVSSAPLLASGAVGDAVSRPDFLALVLDLNLLAWAGAGDEARNGGEPADAAEGVGRRSQQGLALLKDAIDAVQVFVNAHGAMQHGNGLAVWAAGLGDCSLLFSSLTASASASLTGGASAARPAARGDSSTYAHFLEQDEAIVKGVQESIARFTSEFQKAGGVTTAPTGVVSAVAQALCHTNRLAPVHDPVAVDVNRSATAPSIAVPKPGAGGATDPRVRILVLSVSSDASAQYVPMMNSIFAAQKKGVTIDVLKILGADSVFLQQASHLTSGTYFRLRDPRGLLQTLLTMYLPSPSTRPFMNLPNQDEVDFRAACFCHRRIVDVGYVCSVCLSIFCSPRPSCFTCETSFPADTLARFRKQRAAMGAAEQEADDNAVSPQAGNGET
ncbi:transcription factor Tfb4 [Tilletiopsis washingtonensis]|uniref:General transcription and DNA repair factor IIH subunit TFB4 n=1 Tax=Tilletiopsis washingtonensis TaxID=58919 RepID=A0A316Z8X6_9BASI|nr:transcription factor Tfb4 [Tilletiopsis washingtonensis]PWN98031.1 transcription factor Tfb4 [Tilletiopsis washingtonensis]